MSTQVQFRRGTTTQNNAFTGAQGELSIDTDLKTIRLHDGTTAGGGSTTLNNISVQTALYKTFSTGSVWQGNAVALAYGGTGSALTASAGAVPYSTSSGLALNVQELLVKFCIWWYWCSNLGCCVKRVDVASNCLRTRSNRNKSRKLISCRTLNDC